ncbi:MAG TPA: PAS domain S-box protein [Gammaproteobacteria bacterium]
MPETLETRTQTNLRRAESMLLAAAATLAAVTLLLWSPPLAAQLPPAWVLMHLLSAAGMLVAAAALWISGHSDASWRRYAAFAGAGPLLILGVLGLSGRLPGGDEAMSPSSGLGFILLGLLLPVSRVYRGLGRTVADVLTLGLALFELVMLMGYLFASSRDFGETSAIRIPLTSVACFFLLAAVMIMRRSGGGMLAVLRGDRIGSRIVRVAIPLALALPLVLSLIRAYVVSTGVLSPAYASAASISFICLCVTLLALLMGWRINRLEQEVRELLQSQADVKLQESEQRYTDLVEQSISGFVVRRPDGQLALVNEAYRKMTGYSREELLNLKARDLVVDQGVIERVQRLQPGESTHIETFLKRKDGSLLEVEYVTQKMRNGNLQSVLLDISHRKQLQKQRDESERRYAELVEQAQEGIMVRRPNGDIVFVNETFCRMLDYRSEEMTRLNVREIVHPEDVETIQQIQQLGHGGHLRLEKRMLCKGGAVIFVEVSAKRLRNGDIQTTVQDVTEQLIAEQARAESEQRYQDLVEQAADAIWLRSVDGRMLFVNGAGCELLGYTRDELLQSSSRQLIHASDPDTFRWLDKLKPLGTLRIERVMRHRDGHPIPVEASAHRLPDGSLQVISHDISERKRIEEELRNMSRRLGEAQETERRSIARELHDEVGQSLTATRINLRDLEQDAQGGPFAERLTDASNIISDLLSKVRQMSLDLHPSVLDDLGLAAALRWCVRTRTTGSKLEVRLDLPEDLPRFDEMAEITLFRIFQESLSNALRHAQAKHLDARLHHSDGRLLLTVKDDGRGFDAEAARRTALSGKSLGLLGMQERARLAGGELTLISAPGKGTEVSVSLPVDER